MIAKLVKVAVAVATIGVAVYAARRVVANVKTNFGKQALVNEINNTADEILVEAKENNLVLTDEDNMELEAFQKLTRTDDIVSLESALSILKVKRERITGKSAEQFEEQRKKLGADIVNLISVIHTSVREKKIELNKLDVRTFDAANIAVLANAKISVLKEHYADLQLLLVRIEASE